MDTFKAPWKLTDGEDEVGIDYASPGYYANLHIMDAAGNLVVGCDEYDVFSSEANRADVIKLLLAAPDLYEALKEAADMLYLYSAGPTGIAAGDVARKARAALLKASPSTEGQL